MKKTVLSLILVAGLATGAPLAQGQSAADLYHSGVQLEEVKGDLEGAIAIYKNVLERFPGDRATSAKAQLQLGICYQRLGRPDARAAYDTVIRSYADQPDAVATAKARVASLGQGPGDGSAATMVARQIWTGRDVSVEGRPSADGRHVTFVDWTSTKTGNVAIRDLVTGEHRRLTHATTRAEGSAEAPIFSPDDKVIVYIWESSIRLIGSDGSKPRVLVPRTPGLVPFDLCWSPDGRTIAAAFTDYGGDKTSRIVLISVADGATTRLKSTGWRSPELGGFSPDGKLLLFGLGRSSTGRDQNILAVAIDGSRETTIVESASNDMQPKWTPDGRAVVFVSNRSGTPALWAVRVDQGVTQAPPELIRPNIGQIRAMGFTRDGSYFYGTFNAQSDIYAVTMDPSTLAMSDSPTALTDRFVGSNTAPSWSPDGTRVAFVRGPDRQSKSLVIRSLSDGVERTLPTKLLDGYFAAQFGPAWFPDGRSVLVPDNDLPNRKTSFRRVNVDSGEESTLFEGTYQTVWPIVAIAPDGRSIFFTRSEQDKDPDMNNLRLVRRDQATGQETELLRAVSDGVGFFGLTLSPDGRRLAFMANVGKDQRHLMTLPVEGGTPSVVFRGGYSNPQPQAAVWTRDGKHLLFKADDGNQRTRVWAAPLDGSAARPLNLVTDGIVRMHLSPDGTRIAFTGMNRTQELWSIKNLMPGHLSKR